VTRGSTTPVDSDIAPDIELSEPQGPIAAAAGAELARAGESVARAKSELQAAIGSQDLQTIGSVVDRLRDEFPDLSVSKVRYLEEQGLITPRRTRSGYRLFSAEDFERLHSVLTLQRDQYLPLKVIRRELDRTPAGKGSRGVRRTDLIEPAVGHEQTADELVRRLGAEPELLSELEEYEIVRPRQVSGVKRYSDIDAAIVAAAVDLAQVGLRPKNLRILKSAVDRETGLIEQVVLPVLRSPRMDHQREALDLIQSIVAATSQLRQLLIARNVRRLTSGQPPV
jgi:DNA-binding transcriptional MerR regulator